MTHWGLRNRPRLCHRIWGARFHQLGIAGVSWAVCWLWFSPFLGILQIELLSSGYCGLSILYLSANIGSLTLDTLSCILFPLFSSMNCLLKALSLHKPISSFNLVASMELRKRQSWVYQINVLVFLETITLRVRPHVSSYLITGFSCHKCAK